MPSFDYENEAYLKGYTAVCGCDEAGRGPLSGPVVAAACILSPDEPLEGVDDSKKLTEKKRERLYDLEYNKLGLPRPDLVLYLDVPTDFTEAMMRRREADTNTHADIHEQDMEYLATCRRTGKAAAEFYGWTVISCVRDGVMRSIEDIHEEIYRHVAACLEETT